MTGEDKYMWGGNREKAIQRDGEKCVNCGMTRADHKAKFGKDFDVDHIDGVGTNVPVSLRNNSLDNLRTLCRPCHMKHGKKVRKYSFEYYTTGVAGHRSDMVRVDIDLYRKLQALAKSEGRSATKQLEHILRKVLA